MDRMDVDVDALSSRDLVYRVSGTLAVRGERSEDSLSKPQGCVTDGHP
jgi:hypothetical protein